MPRFRIHTASPSVRPTTRSSSSFAKTTSGSRRRTAPTEFLDAAVPDGAPRCEIDADPRALGSCELDGTQCSAAHRFAHQRVARDVEVVAGRRATRVELVRAQLGGAPAIRSHRASRRRVRRASRSSRCDPSTGPTIVDTGPASLVRASSPASSSPGLADEASARSERGCPGGDVRGLPARADSDLGVGVAADGDRPGEPDDDVEGEISESADEHRSGS